MRSDTVVRPPSGVNVAQRIGIDAPRLLMVRLPPWMHRENRHPHDLMWPVTTLYAQQRARTEGWRASILDLHVEPLDVDGVLRRVAAQGPDVLVIDSMTPTLGTATQLATMCKEQNPRLQVWAAGQHATARPSDFEGAASPFRGVLTGELDAAIERIWRPMSKSCSGRPPRLDHLEQLPPLDPRGLLLDRYAMRSTHVPRFGRQRWGFLLSSRGCPYRCTFCSPTLRQSYGRGFRAQPPEALADDMVRLHRDHGIGAFYFIDDVMTLDRQRVLDLCDALRRRRPRFRFVVQTRPDLVDPEVLAALKSAGCAAIKMGVESGSDRVLKRIKKGARRERILQAARDIRTAGLGLTAYYMLGHPGETRADIEQTFTLAETIDADMIQVAFHTPYPGSAAWREQGREDADFSGLQHYETVQGNASEVPADELERLQRRFYLGYYLRPRAMGRYLARRALYRGTDPAEWALVARTLRYLALQRRGRDIPVAMRTAAAASPTVPQAA